jgi:Na+-transporting NADH:ubiquinone oxidoreductase subunit F
MVARRDYSLTGTESALAVERGLADADWFRPAIDPTRLRALQVRGDARATRDTLLWLGLLVVAAWCAWWSLGTGDPGDGRGVTGVLASIVCFGVYGALYGGAADARWHECGHGTAFRSRWANEVVYLLACLMLWRGPTLWRWSHHRHHTDTIIVGRDAEIAFPRPPSPWRTLWGFTHIEGSTRLIGRLARHAVVGLDADACDLIPEHERRRAVWEARVIVGSMLAVVVWAVLAGSWLPVLFIGGPTVYGGWLMVFFGITQHAGLREDVLDHRLNTRTVMMNPVLRFLYLNMNHHVEHHLFPTVPYHALPALHREVGDQLAPALPSTWAAYREILSTMRHQRRDPSFEIPLDVPAVSGTGRIDVGERNWVMSSGTEVTLTTVDDMAIGEVRRIDHGDRSYVLCRVDEGEFALVDGMCTHSRVHLAGGALLGCEIECPKHNARFDVRTGEVRRGPARDGLGVVAVTVRNGRVTTSFERILEPPR